MKKEIVSYKEGSPYASAIKSNGFLFVSGSVAVDPQKGTVVEGGIQEQTRQVLDNLKHIVEDAGVSFDDVVKVNVYMTDISEFSQMNAVYREYFPSTPPTRTTVGVKELAREEFKIEIDLVAAL